MTAPLNGHLLNGSTPFATWAWGEGRAESTATGEASNRVYSDAVAKAIATATTVATGERKAYLDGEKAPFAEVQMEAIRYAVMEGQGEGVASEAITPVRTAWFDAPTLLSIADTDGQAERWKILTGTATAAAKSPLDNDAVNVTRYMISRRRPGQANAYIAESRIKRLRVNQVGFRGTGIGRATIRALPNTALGFSVISPESETVSFPLLINSVRDFRGSSTGTVEAIVDSSKVRIIEGGMLCEAEVRAEPTITTSVGRFSYNSGITESTASQSISNRVLRRPGNSVTTAFAIEGKATTYLRRGLKGRSEAFAISRAHIRNNTWKYLKGKVTGSATLDTTWKHYRWREITGSAAAEAYTQANNLHYRPTLIGAYTGEATSQSSVIAIRAAGDVSAQVVAESNAWNRRTTFGRDDADAAATVDILAYGRRGRIMTGTHEGEALTQGVALREVWVDGMPKIGDASVIRFVYRVNIDSLAPNNRTLLVGATSRELILPEANREYLVQ